MAPWTAITVFVLGAGGLVIDTPSPDALCPPLEQTRESVRSRLGSVELEGTWRATYGVVHREQGDFVALKLVDPAGTTRLERELPAQGESCATLAQVIALVLERYFLRPESVAHTAGPSASAPATAPEPGPRSYSRSGTGPTSALPPEKSRLEPSLSRPSRPTTRGEIDLGLWATSAWLAPFARGKLRIEPRTLMSLVFAVDEQGHESPVGKGYTSALRLPISLGVAREVWRVRPWVTSLGAELLGLYERVTTHQLAVNGSSGRLIPGLGLRGALTFEPANSPWVTCLEATATGLVRPLAPDLQVDGKSVDEPPLVVLGLGLSVGWRL